MTVPEDQTSMEDPKAVYQNWLDETSNALMAGDTAAFTKAVSLPFVMRTVVDVTVQETLDDVLEDAENVVDALRSQQVTDYVRLVKRARYLTEDLIEGWHTTYVLRGAINVVAPYGNRMLMARIDGVWKVCEAEHELNGHRVPLMLLRSEPGCFRRSLE